MASNNATTPVPPGYVTPSFPSLYWLIGPRDVVQPNYLYHEGDIWRFTLYWTLIVFEAAHLAVAFYAMIMVWWGGRTGLKGPKGKKEEDRKGKRPPGGKVKKFKMLWIVPVVYAVVAGVEAVLAGSVVGLM